MPVWDDISSAISAATGASFAIQSRAGIAGGCINAAYRIDGCGQSYFVKLNDAAKAAMFEAEAAGLSEIARTRTLRVPHPICQGVNAGQAWLVLEYIELNRNNASKGNAASMRELGAGLARMHESAAPRFGWHRDNTIGATPQINTQNADWMTFWRDHRLGYQLRLAAANGHGGRLQKSGERLLAGMNALLASHQPRPSLLHGDLWGGNIGFASDGQPLVFDPAVYYGDREADLAMTELFGGFSTDFHAAYRDRASVDAGYAVRKTLYNLYHVLNHLNLFGGSYLAQAQNMIAQLLAEKG
ncbi:MAG: fructosamine kinase family protein [Burkholderiales bacterium]|nr:fructosamine kinase family protein [Burkholderiales bacterium]